MRHRSRLAGANNTTPNTRHSTYLRRGGPATAQSERRRYKQNMPGSTTGNTCERGNVPTSSSPY